MTTFLAMILGGMNRPELLSDDQRIQLVFTDEFEVSGNHFTSVCQCFTSSFISFDSSRRYDGN